MSYRHEIDINTICSSLDKAIEFMDEGLTDNKILFTDASPHLEMRESTKVSSVYLPSYMLHSLSFAKGHAKVPNIVSKISEFLLLQKEDKGIWRFFGNTNPFPPPDFDDTSCVLAGLKENGIDVSSNMYELLDKCRSEAGKYYTWIDRHMNQASQFHTDGGVNSNILFIGTLNGLKFAEISKFINQYSIYSDFNDFSVWSVSRYASIYLVTRVYKDSRLAELEQAIKNITKILNENQEVNGSWGNALDSILALTALVNIGGSKYSILRAIKHLVSIQEQTGDFGLNAAFRDFTPVYYGSRFFSTGLFIEAASKFIKREKSEA